MIANAVDQNPGAFGFLFDGFPRTIAQAEALDSLLSAKQSSIAAVLFLEVNEDELIKRLVGRAQTSGRLDDADPEVQKKRQMVYKNETLPVAGYYDAQGKVDHVVGEGTVEEIFAKLCGFIDSKI
jgi:adenylate kinase